MAGKVGAVSSPKDQGQSAGKAFIEVKSVNFISGKRNTRTTYVKLDDLDAAFRNRLPKAADAGDVQNAAEQESQ